MSKKDIGITCFIGGFLSWYVIALVCYAMCSPFIEPIDVYKGNTTLEYRVIDGVKVDSVVVWKYNKQ